MIIIPSIAPLSIQLHYMFSKSTYALFKVFLLSRSTILFQINHVSCFNRLPYARPSQSPIVAPMANFLGINNNIIGFLKYKYNQYYLPKY